jgi:hypothetical protein
MNWNLLNPPQSIWIEVEPNKPLDLNRLPNLTYEYQASIKHALALQANFQSRKSSKPTLYHSL